MGYRKFVEKKDPAPRRIILYRGKVDKLGACSVLMPCFLDGVSEGQFKHVLERGESSSPPRSPNRY